MIDDERLKFLLLVQSAHQICATLPRNQRGRLAVQLNRPGVLSLTSLSDTLRMSKYHLRPMLDGQQLPKVQAKMNPAHASLLMQVAARHKVEDDELQMMLNSGTDITVIAVLTGMSVSTLQRQVKRW